MSGPNPPKKWLQPSDTVNSLLGGFVIDKYYRTAFTAPPIEEYALYGSGNVLRDHYSEFYDSVDAARLLRAKHYCAPIIEVRSIEEMRQVLERIPARGEGKMFFRGQGALYPLSRPDRIKRLLFGESCALEPSLLTAAARKNTDYDSLHFALLYFIQERLLGEESDKVETAAQYEAWREELTSPLCNVDYAVMALAQHYGIPTHGLDVTTDIDVATWFATNRFVEKSGRCRYHKLKPSDWNPDIEKWPVIFVGQVVTNSLGMSLQGCEELEKFGIKALRPQRQSALFFHGGHSDHQNRMAESLVCAFRLGPDMYSTACSFDQLFPSPDEDAAYKCMLDFARLEPYSSLGSKYVQNFHAPASS